MAFMDRFLSMVRVASPDPRLSYPRYRALAWIDDAGQVSVTGLSSNLGIARSTTSEMVGRMERDGLVRRAEDTQDARSVVVELTPLGQRLVRRRRGELFDAQRAMFHRLSPEDQKALVDAFDTLDRLTRRVIHP
jgi:DNA-binding MarR family transcriptional regulator